MYKSDIIAELSKALTGFQKEVENVTKDATNPFFKSKYASLENVISTVKPLLAKHGLSYSQIPDADGLNTILMHTSGEHIGAYALLHLKDQTPQGQGSAITYMRRYALSSILGIATEDDDDGNAASAPKAKPAKKENINDIVPGKPATPKSVTVQKQKEEIKAMLDEGADAPLKTKSDYENECMFRTGMKLEEANYTDILAKLKE